MSESPSLTAIAAYRIIPVITLHDPRDAEPLGRSLKAGGLPIAEITLRTGAGLDAIGRMSADPDLLVGAGTVTTERQADAAVAAGARFIVSPGIRPALLRHCLGLGLPVFPGAVTPSEVMSAVDCGVHVVKFFPASQFGGVNTIAALAAPFPDIRFIPTGGIGADSAGGYLAHPAVVAVGGSWMVTASLLKENRFDEITALTAAAATLCAAQVDAYRTRV